LKLAPICSQLPEQIHGVSMIAPPAIAERIVEQAPQAGSEHTWMRPGAGRAAAAARARALGMSVIGGDACVLVELG
jgi:predicted CoA-binding protein